MDYPTIMQRAYAIEWDRNELKVGQGNQKETITSLVHNNNKKRKWEAGLGRNTSGISTCNTSSKKHRGPCLFGKGVCYLCGQRGHVRKDCPQEMMCF